MNTKLRLLLASLLVSSVTFAGVSGGNYGGVSITDSTSPHNLSARLGDDDNGEVCVYCHTPHAANISFAGAPLWNKSDSNETQVYTTYGTTVGGTEANTTIASASLVCLSCHDGISAVDSIANAPGSGMQPIAGSQNIVNILGTPYGGNIGGTMGVSAASGATAVDLSNDHPISIVYTPGRASLRETTDTLDDGENNESWVTPSGSQLVSALLRGGNVECVSCHDPHNATGVAQSATNIQVNYLRHTNERSELCFGCHAK
ncbi:cytochrome c3 family protein [Candidatus Sulfurimonas baltica]|uniref:Doubled CXXCH motif domain-containing protein n=1 Tax=Candidatus Sulfurimonas baltica TaxID=2740404 RepID=A0A7S7LWI4_9BACT|nr:cytochrome c3 family protein [Candidatus Sulfurimonas baltica]QOY51874.1 hypothetical protein HUE88_12360 [Candidatus Sulfurimonas baltica]